MTFEEYLDSISNNFVPHHPTPEQRRFAKAYDMAVQDGYQLQAVGGFRSGNTWILSRLEEYWDHRHGS